MRAALRAAPTHASPLRQKKAARQGAAALVVELTGYREAFDKDEDGTKMGRHGFVGLTK